MNTEEVQQLKEKCAYLEKMLVAKTNELSHKDRLLEIVAALDEVRERTIKMRNSSELSETSTILLHQLKELGINAIRTGVGIFDDEHDAMEHWLTTVSDSQEVMKILDYFSLHIHPVYENIIPARKQNKPYVLTVLKGNEVGQYYQMMSTYLSRPQHQVYHNEEFFYSFFFFHGALNVVTSEPLSEEECNIMVQFALAFGLIYMRFLDLQIAENQTREALRKISLERVRAEITSMRNANDLEHITPLIWKELVTLGLTFIRCGVFIISDKDRLINAFLSTPEGKSLAVLHLHYDELQITRAIVDNWKLQKVYTENWDKNQFESWIQSMLDQGQIEEKIQYQDAETPLESLYLHFIPFDQGMLYVGSLKPLAFDQIDLVKSLANSFAVAYARYEDFKKLEDAKIQVEKTLSELKATQSHLIQSEKMASLGELTAGIAHEIQNPLNFVNNFSEVNIELVEELRSELAKVKTQYIASQYIASPQIDLSNMNEAESILNDLEINQQKINHHGRRADSIVKGMLQHSRTSTGVKELTDINGLCDEYLRLSYHGLRAKDKSFNADFVTEFDTKLPLVNVVPQEIGRVLLNIINNAFQACTAIRSADGEVNPRPTVTVKTAKVRSKSGNSGVEITIKDNGHGIPDHIKDKIFQPFFSTKPTGQGTGLGLSISYDIVKAHGGELKLKSLPTGEEGSEFIIKLQAG